MHLDEFQPQSATFELRHEQNYSLWDRAGRLWSHWVKEYPDVPLAEARDAREEARKLLASGVARRHSLKWAA
jgi:hypothetical protein